ncbi:MAG: hypothetical protein MI806_28380 [Minwuiales bacterium]|nr:hypothetical protein [Minwuiales bacterium]
MTDKLRKQIDKGAEASFLLERLDGFANEYQAKLVGKWEAERDPVERDLIWHRYQSVLDFERHLKRIVSDGRDAERRLKEIENG